MGGLLSVGMVALGPYGADLLPVLVLFLVR